MWSHSSKQTPNGKPARPLQQQPGGEDVGGWTASQLYKHPTRPCVRPHEISRQLLHCYQSNPEIQHQNVPNLNTTLHSSTKCLPGKWKSHRCPLFLHLGSSVDSGSSSCSSCASGCAGSCEACHCSSCGVSQPSL